MHAKKGDWVQIHKIVLTPEQRTGRIPEDTKRVPLESWNKGYLAADAEIGDEVTVTTITGRKVSGELVAVNPIYCYSFGETFIPELQQVGAQARNIVTEYDK